MIKKIVIILIILISTKFIFSQDHEHSKSLTSKDKSKCVYNSKAVLLNILISNQKKNEFEIDTNYGYIKSGLLFDSNHKNAVIISFDSTWMSSFFIYELKNNNWIEIYSQDSVGFSRVYGLKAFVKDFNFDGIKDIAVLNEISNGQAIMTFRLWLRKPDNTFKYIPVFKEIGTPTIDNMHNTINGYSACCVLSDITFSDYKWEGYNLILKHSLHISRNYALKLNDAVEKFYEYVSPSQYSYQTTKYKN